MEAEVFGILAGLAAAAVGGIVYGLSKLKGVKVKNDFAQELLYRAADAASVAVDFVYNTYVKELKAEAEDGKLTPEEAKEAHKRAIEVVKSGLGPQLWKAATKSGVDVDLVASAAVESALTSAKDRARKSKK